MKNPRNRVPFIRRGAETNDIWIEDLRGAVWNAVRDSGLTWKELAALSDIGSATVAKFAYGETKRPVFRTLFRVSDALGFKISFTKVRG